MKEFILIFRLSQSPDTVAPAEMQDRMSSWMSWLDSISSKGQLAPGGNHLNPEKAKVVRKGKKTTDGPFTELKEFIAGYIIVNVNSVEEAVEIADRCPILNGDNNSVEVREVAVLNM
ncbi:MAG: YciI family protein [Bacteroidota bacterium]